VCAAAGIPVPGGRGRDHYEVKYAELIAQAVATNRAPRFAAILIDEGQDFHPSWVRSIEQGLLTPGGKLFVFYDPLQDVRGLGTDLSKAFGEPLRNYTNCRNTRHIADFVRGMDSLFAEMEVAKFAPAGVEPVIKTYVKPGDQCPVIEDLVLALLQKHDLQPRQLLLLSPYAKPNTCLGDRSQLAGLPLVDYAQRYREPRARVLFHDTIAGFKGCEADVIILHDVHGNGPNVGLEDLYVACSRARAGLFVFRQDDFGWPSNEPPLPARSR
jgi:hypothetical protein